MNLRNLLAAFSCTAVASFVVADPAPVERLPEPTVAPALFQAAQAPYLSDEEKREIRIGHGLWTPSDLADPAARARAALAIGAWDDASFADPASGLLDRVEAMLRGGDAQHALALLADASGLRATRLRAESLEATGRSEDAARATEHVAGLLAAPGPISAEDIAEGVRSLIVRARITGAAAQDYHLLNNLLARARDQLDRLSPAVPLAETLLLYDKDSRSDAAEAAMRALSLHPRHADGWAMMGRLAVDGFNMDGAEQAAATLDAQVRTFTGDPDAVSAHAGVIRAAAALRQNDADGADAALAPVLERFPLFREGLFLSAAAAAVRDDADALRARLAQIEAVEPGSARGVFAVGRALSEARQYGEAAEYLERAGERAPHWAPPRIELGLLELQSGRDDRAASALRAATRLDPFHVRARNSLTLIEELLTYSKIESEHFIVRFRPGVDEVLAREMLAPLEEIHQVVSTGIDHEPSQKTIIELLPDHEWFGVRITGMPAIHTIAAATGPVIAMEAPRLGPKHEGEYDWVRVIRHEYTHTVTLSRTRNRIPHWFTEAAAVHLEAGPRDYSTASLLASALERGEIFDMRKINLAFVRPEKPTDRAQAYAQGHWMYQFIIQRWGERAPLDLMDRYAQGVREDKAMSSVLGMSQESFLQEFLVWAREDVRSWGLAHEPSLGRLLAEHVLSDPALRADALVAVRVAAGAAGRSLARLAAPEAPGVDVAEPTPARIDVILAQHPAHPDALASKISFELARLDGDPDMSLVPLLETYAGARPVDSTPHRMLARLYLASEDAAQQARANPHLEHLDAREERSATYAEALARRYAALGDLERAHSRAERATQIAPYRGELRELAATVALMRNDWPTAERHLRALVTLEPDRAIHRDRLEKLRERMAQSENGAGAPG